MRKKTKIFRNHTIDKNQLKQLMSWAFTEFGMKKASYLANQIKKIGFEYGTQAGLSLSIEDLRVPPSKKKLLQLANKEVSSAEFDVIRGKITEVERFQKVINTWNTTSEALKDQVVHYFRQTDPLNSIYIMAFSGARGNLSQVRQLVGMRGLMADPNGQIIDLPIITNFREGLTVTDYIISSYGARKGLVDTALRTADSGYLTRRLIDVAQDMITRERNCKTKDGISLTTVFDGSNTLISLSDRVIGRLLALPLKNPKTNQRLADSDQEITPLLAKKIVDLKIQKVVVRSPLTCGSSRSICQQCYGWNLAYGRLIDLGEAIGIIAAQSIGEPGTQLTMRTFHTGGVFTTEPSRQIRSQYSGKIIFSNLLKTQIIRTQYGELAFRSENEASLNILTFENTKVVLKILPETLIFVKNNSYIKKNDLLFEFTSKTRKTGEEKAFKYVYANESGQVQVEKKETNELENPLKSKLSGKSTCLLWILSGQVYDLPLGSNLKIHPFSKVEKNQTIGEANLISLTGGYIKTLSVNKEESENQLTKIPTLKILYDSKGLTHLNLYLEQEIKGKQRSIIYGSNNRQIIFNTFAPSTFSKQNRLVIGDLINTRYRTKTGGRFYFLPLRNHKEKLSMEISKFQNGSTLFYIPEATYKIHRRITQLYGKAGDFIEEGFELFKNEFAKINGVLEIHETKKGSKDLIIKPGKFIEVTKSKVLKTYVQSILFPGETLFNNQVIKELSYTQIKTIKNKTYLCLYPVVRYEILQPLNELSHFSLTAENLDIAIEKDEDFYFTKKIIKESQPIQFVKHQLICNPFTTAKTFQTKLEFEEVAGKIKLILFILENFNLYEIIPNELKKAKVKITSLVQKKQYVEPYTKTVSFQILTLNQNKIFSIKEQLLEKERKILLLTNDDYKTIFHEEPKIPFQKNKLFRLGEKSKTSSTFAYSGLIKKVWGESINLHLGQPYLFSQGAIVEKRPGDLIQKGESLGQLVYARTKTGDIVQGLPRVEEILEARKPKLEATLSSQPGIVTKLQASQGQLQVWIRSGEDKTRLQFKKDFYKFSSSQRLLVGKFEFINVGQPLNDASINPHTLLDIYFLYYESLELLTSYQAAYRSLRKIQAILLNSVQAVYYSQGVSIADKHVEIIIRQLTGKVIITCSGESPFLQEELVELRQAYYINSCLKEKTPAKFKPVLLGITKAALKTTSFISAASFQSTTRILTEAAIEGKIDWLRGLKENVVVGRLIPAGTGFNAYSDISSISIKLPSEQKRQNLKEGFQSPQTKYKNQKNRKKFKFV